MIENTRCINLRDMHPMQAHALHDFIAMAVDLARLIPNPQTLRVVETEADELVRLFGGVGVKVEIEKEEGI